MKKVVTGLQLMSGDTVPMWYGLAYSDINSDAAVFYPIPLNLLVRAWRRLVWAVRFGKKEALQEAFERGRAEGRQFERERILARLSR